MLETANGPKTYVDIISVRFRRKADLAEQCTIVGWVTIVFLYMMVIHGNPLIRENIMLKRVSRKLKFRAHVKTRHQSVLNA